MVGLPAGITETHPVQLLVVGVVGVLNVLILLWVNARKQRKSDEAHPGDLPWSTRRNAYWLLFSFLFALSWSLDCLYPLHWQMLYVKSYVMGFPVGLLDLYFSRTGGVSLKVVLGAALWCSTLLVKQWLVDAFFLWYAGNTMGAPPKQVTDMSIAILAMEIPRYVVGLVAVGMLGDLVFSPMHRLAHHPLVYRDNHKVHHSYTNSLTALVLYHGTMLDDFLMPLCAALGAAAYTILCSLICPGLEFEVFSNVALYLIVFNTLMSHAHDTRCARLLAPLPDSLNFVAYHYVHHLSPCHNYGLTEPSDVLWDWILGVKTIRKLEDFDQRANGEWDTKSTKRES